MCWLFTWPQHVARCPPKLPGGLAATCATRVPPMCPVPCWVARQNRSDTTSRFTRARGGWGSGADSGLCSTPGPGGVVKQPPKKSRRGVGRPGWLVFFCFFFARCGSPPADSESQNLAFSYTPSNLPSSGKLLPPGREIRFGSAGSLRNPHASDLKGRGERKEKACDKCEKNSAGGSPPRDGAFWELRAGLQHPNLHDFASKPPCALRHPRAPAAPSPPSPKPAPQLCPLLSHRLLHLHTHTYSPSGIGF